MEKIIVGIHGLSNKPEKTLHEQTWIDSINEGLAHVGGRRPFQFQLVQWSDLLYHYPLHQDADFYFDALFDDEPYYQARPSQLSEYKDSWLDSMKSSISGAVGTVFDALSNQYIVENAVQDLLRSKLKDLAFYYDPTKLIKNRQGEKLPAREVLRNELINTLQPLKGKRIMLLSHSMGSIIAYDVLRLLGRQDGQPWIEHFVTLGSPLGIPHVKLQIAEECAKPNSPVDMHDVRTPSVVAKSWCNFSDKRDKVCFDTHLADDYYPNRHGVQAHDDLVWNDYTSPITHKPNPHKLYGYLRCPEVARHIAHFIAS